MDPDGHGIGLRGPRELEETAAFVGRVPRDAPAVRADQASWTQNGHCGIVEKLPQTLAVADFVQSSRHVFTTRQVVDVQGAYQPIEQSLHSRGDAAATPNRSKLDRDPKLAPVWRGLLRD